MTFGVTAGRQIQARIELTGSLRAPARTGIVVEGTYGMSLLFCTCCIIPVGSAISRRPEADEASMTRRRASTSLLAYFLSASLTRCTEKRGMGNKGGIGSGGMAERCFVQPELYGRPIRKDRLTMPADDCMREMVRARAVCRSEAWRAARADRAAQCGRGGLRARLWRTGDIE